MIAIKKIYFELDGILVEGMREISFERGVNFVIGEESKKRKGANKKMNSVGKSLLVEIIDYCFLKTYDSSRVSRIPVTTLNPKIDFCMDIEIEDDESIELLTIKRNRANTDGVIIVISGKEQHFDKINQARLYLAHLLMKEKKVEAHPSLRGLLALLIRDEDTLYKNILYPYHESHLSSFEDVVKPHLYLFGIDLLSIGKISEYSKEIKSVKKVITDTRRDFRNRGVQEREIASYINDLEDKVEQLSQSVDELRPSETSIQLKRKLNNLQVTLEGLLAKKTSKEYLIEKIKRLPEMEKINTSEVKKVFNHFKSGLGDLVSKDFEEVLTFKEQIDAFQTDLMERKVVELNQEIAQIDQEISTMDSRIAELYSSVNAGQKVADLREMIAFERESAGELNDLVAKYNLLEEKKARKRSLEKRKSELIDEVGVSILEAQEVIDSFEQDLKEMHSFITDNKRCHFKIDISESKAEFIDFNYRTDFDGGSGVNRIKTLIYDVLLMTNKHTSKRHPRFLIHDNIFASSGKDDMVRSLNYIHKKSTRSKFQYIVTINKDEFDTKSKDLTFDFRKTNYIELNRDTPLLGETYSEVY